MKPIRTGGENVYPEEVEAVLRYHPAIADAAVVGLPDPVVGERLVALVTPESGQTAPTAEEVRRFCIGRLTGFKVPREVLTIATIPRDGKRVDYVWARTTAATLLGSPANP